ncbi:MAG: Txe/YoeB family addiction module toxin [Verrucomicrobia bacterium]|nr:Txe/YoeB family addiction module toxin [Verrucomicrobiota bacterium]
MRSVTFQQGAFDEFTSWAEDDAVIFERLVRLISEARRDPFTGIGKPEPLKHRLQGHWSRRITEEHRLVYRVTPEAIVVASCKYHYK